MLQYQPNIERMFHHVLLDAIPLLFLAPEDYRNTLAKELDALYYQYRSGGSCVQFTNSIDTINKMMEGAGDHWGSRTKDQIRAFRSNWQGFDERITALEQGIVTRKPDKIKKPAIHAEPEIVTKPVSINKSQTEQVLGYITDHPGERSPQIIIGTGLPSNSCRKAIFELFKKDKILREGKEGQYRYYILGGLPELVQTIPELVQTTTQKTKPSDIRNRLMYWIKLHPGKSSGEITKGCNMYRDNDRNYISDLYTKGLIRREGNFKHYRYYPINPE